MSLVKLCFSAFIFCFKFELCILERHLQLHVTSQLTQIVLLYSTGLTLDFCYFDLCYLKDNYNYMQLFSSLKLSR